MNDFVDMDLGLILELLPDGMVDAINEHGGYDELLEIILDLGREPEARFLGENITLLSREVNTEDIQYVTQRISDFGDDNRAGIERTLHRISAIRNRGDNIIGLTLRVGRAVHGTVNIVKDLIMSGNSVLLLGRPGVGKTTMLREVARVLADEACKRVMVVDTSNEIAGDGDIPHSGIGKARRMQVPSPVTQHALMIEAVENHMPQVIIIDEIGTELEANAARTIAERGVQLVATAHGNTLENLILNPTLSDLVGGIESVTLGDIEARRRRTKKTILERRSPPTFQSLVEIHGWSSVAVHSDVSRVVDSILRGYGTRPELRTIDSTGNVRVSYPEQQTRLFDANGDKGMDKSLSFDGALNAKVDKGGGNADNSIVTTRILPYGVNKGKLQQVVQNGLDSIELVTDIANADLLLTTKNFYRRRTRALVQAEEIGKPVYVLRKNTLAQIQQFFRTLSTGRKSYVSEGEISKAIKEAEKAAIKVDGGDTMAGLNPQGSYIRRLQHQVAEKHGFSSSSTGQGPSRHVTIYRQ